VVIIFSKNRAKITSISYTHFRYRRETEFREGRGILFTRIDNIADNTGRGNTRKRRDARDETS